MRIALVLLVAAACSKGSAKGIPDPDPKGTVKDPPANGTEAEPVEQAKGVTIKAEAAEFSGTYDKVFGRYTNGNEPNSLVFVRNCPKLTCDGNPWEVEAVAHVCPKGYLATATFEGDKPGKFKVDLKHSGPVGNPSTGTTEGVTLEIKTLGNDGITGTAKMHGPTSDVKGDFSATICPRT